MKIVILCRFLLKMEQWFVWTHQMRMIAIGCVWCNVLKMKRSRIALPIKWAPIFFTAQSKTLSKGNNSKFGMHPIMLRNLANQ